MKKEKIDDNQLTFFDVIDGGKHEEDKKNIMKFKKKQLIDVQYAPYEEMFSGFNKIQAITFSYDLSFVNYPPLARAEVGASGLRPSFFLLILHRQAPVFHRLSSIYR